MRGYPEGGSRKKLLWVNFFAGFLACRTDTNNAASYGGGLYLPSAGTTTISSTSISDNESAASGGGIYFTSGGTVILSLTSVTINNNTVTNTSSYDGGGLYLKEFSGGDITVNITDGSINGNSIRSGGGIYATGDSGFGVTLNIDGTTINSNSATSYGGGFYLTSTATTLNLTKSYVQGNSCKDGGGGINNSGTATIINTLITGNRLHTNDWRYGGGIFNGGTLNLYNSTIAGNYAKREGGGLYANGTETIRNSIIYGNTADLGTNDEVQGSINTLTTSNTSTDPLFVDLQQATTSSATTAGDYRLCFASGDPAGGCTSGPSNGIDTGDVTNAPSQDIIGTARPQDVAGLGDDTNDYDMGIYEFIGSNQAPMGGYTADNVIPEAQVTQSGNGDGVITIQWRGKDPETDNVTLKTFEYSVDGGSSWNPPTNNDSSGSLSTNWTDSDGGGTGYTTASDWTGTVHSFTFDTQHSDTTGLNTDQSDVQVRFTLNDSTDDSAQPVTSESFRVDNVIPTNTITSASYNKNTDTMVITGTNFTTMATATTDIKSYVDWSKFVWDINGDGATTADITFVVGDVTSMTVTDATTLTLVFTAAKGTAIEGTTGYGNTGGEDTLDVTAGFSKDAAGNAATTDGISDGTLPTNTAPVGGYTSDDVIPTAQVSQSANGDGVITITWKGRDGQTDNVTLKTFEYSVDGGSIWNPPTNNDSSGSLSTNWTDSDGGGTGYTTAADFGAAAAHSFTFNTHHSDTTGLDTDQSDVQVRFTLNDGELDSAAPVTSESFQVDNVIPTDPITSAGYTPSTDTLVITGTNFTTIASATTDIKSYVDWSKFVWDINGDGATTTDITFVVGDVTSLTVTNATTLTLVFTSAKGTTIESNSDYGIPGGADTLDVTAGFSKDAVGNAATTDGLADGTLTTPLVSYTVTKTADTDDGSCDGADCSLREAIEAANASGDLNEITIPAGTYYITRSGTDNTNNLGDFDITTPVNIVGDGSGSTIIRDAVDLASATDRIFHVTNSSAVTIEDVTLQYAKISDDGGCIKSGGNLTITDSVIDSCTANNTNHGGAIYTTAAVTLKNSTVSNCTATDNGGGIYTTGLTITNGATFTDNSAYNRGGAIYNATNAVSISGITTFTNNDTAKNHTTDHGGAIWTSGSITHSSGNITFQNNDAYSGGAIWVDNSSKTITLNAPSFLTNTAVNYGGAIRCYGITITGNASFTDNYAGNPGGAIYNTTSDISINGTATFTNNDTAKNGTSDHGGAIWTSGSITHSGGNIIFENNDAYSGGAIWLNDSSKSVTLVAPSFLTNTAVNVGGAIRCYGITITGGATFTDNSAGNPGGAIYNSTGAISINGTATFTNNDTGTGQTGDRGGSIWSSGNITLNDVSGTSTFQNCNSYDGGAIYLDTGKTFTATNPAFTGNTAVNIGGAIRSFGITVTGGATFENNSTTNDGGAIFNSTNPISINGTILFNNNDAGTASGDWGGAIYSNADITLNDVSGSSTFQNSQAYDGGAINLQSASLTATDITFTGNTAINVGGAIRSYGITITGGATFENNNSTNNDGGAIFNSTSPISINGTIMFDNNDAGTGSSDWGGAIYSDADITLNDVSGSSTFQNSQAYDGGAIYLQSASLTATNITFSNNWAQNVGGALFTYGGTLTVATFTSNYSATNDAGAIYNSTNLLTINGSSNTFNGNYAGSGTSDWGGSIYSTGSLTISNTTFTGRGGTYEDAYEGGAIYITSGDTLTISDSTFASNRVVNLGGAIYTYGGTMSNVTFTGNESDTNDGGAIMNNTNLLTISGTNTFTNNQAASGSGDVGGAIYSTGSLTISGASFSGGSAYEGGAIYITDLDTLTISESSFASNTANNIGGAIRCYGATIDKSTFSNNSTTGGTNDGGAIYSTKALTVTNSTFSANSAGSDGGAIYQTTDCTIKNSTFYNNTATSTGEAIRGGGTCTVENSIIYKSTASSSMCTGVTSNDYNLQYNGTCFTAQANDLSSDPLLGALADNGGSTMTHALQSSSPAIDAANNATCAAPPVNNLDQRGVTRPIDGDPVAGAVCDMGAYEAPAYSTPTISGSIYSDEGTTKITTSTTVNLVVNGTSVGTDTTTTGDYSIAWASLSSGDKILVYIDNDGTNDGNTFTVSNGSSLSGLHIYKDHVIVRHDNSGSLTNADMSSAWISDAGDVLYSVSYNDLTINGASIELFVLTGHTFAPGGAIDTADMDINGTLSSAANAINVSGNWDATGGIFTSTGTVTFDGSSGTKTITPGGTDNDHDFQNIVINDAAGTATFELQGALDVDGNLTVTDGILDTKSDSNYSVMVGGNFNQATTGQFEANSSNITVNGDWDNNGTFTAGTSTVLLSGTGQDLNGPATFYNLTKTVATADTLTFEAGQTTSIASGGTVTFNGASDQMLTLASSTGSSAWNFTINATAVKDIDYVSVSWSDASGSDASQKPINPTNFTDGGNTTDWFPSNTAPIGGYAADNVIPEAQVTQSTDGDGIITINWRGKDAQTNNVTLKTFEYSVNGGSTFNAPTNGDSSGSLSTNWTDSDGGGTGYTTATDWSGDIHSFTFDTDHTDVSGMDGVDQSDVQVRFKLNDGTVDSASYVTSESFQVDNVIPTSTITSASYAPSTDTLTITGTNFTTMAAASTDIKSYVDWCKFVWDINGDDATTANITFVGSDVTSLTITNATTLTLVFTGAKGTAIESTSGYGSAGGADTLDVTAGFSKDAAGNAATTDAAADASLSIPFPVITVTKLSVVISDPVNAATNPKRIPGAVIEYSITPSNTGDASPDANSTYVSDVIGTNGIKYDVTTGVSFTDGTTTSALAIGSITCSDDAAPGPYVYDYTPVPDGDGYDSNITSIKVTTTGTFAHGGAPAPSFTLKYRAQVK